MYTQVVKVEVYAINERLRHCYTLLPNFLAPRYNSTLDGPHTMFIECWKVRQWVSLPPDHEHCFQAHLICHDIGGLAGHGHHIQEARDDRWLLLTLAHHHEHSDHAAHLHQQTARCQQKRLFRLTKRHVVREAKLEMPI